MKKIIVTVDGPAASGKEKIAKYIGKKWDLKHLDSGILYRRLAYIFLSEDINIKNITEIRKKIKQIKKISYQKSKKIRTQEIGKIASKIAVHSYVRNFVNKQQRKWTGDRRRQRWSISH